MQWHRLVMCGQGAACIILVMRMVAPMFVPERLHRITPGTPIIQKSGNKSESMIGDLAPSRRRIDYRPPRDVICGGIVRA